MKTCLKASSVTWHGCVDGSMLLPHTAQSSSRVPSPFLHSRGTVSLLFTGPNQGRVRTGQHAVRTQNGTCRVLMLTPSHFTQGRAQRKRLRHKPTLNGWRCILQCKPTSVREASFVWHPLDSCGDGRGRSHICAYHIELPPLGATAVRNFKSPECHASLSMDVLQAQIWVISIISKRPA